MRQLRLLPITAIAVLGFTAVSHIGASAISLPTDPITFDLNITPPANKPGKNPNSAACIPLSATANPKSNPNANLKRKNGLSNVAGVCNIQRVVPARAWTGTASSTQLAVLDAGFANGNIRGSLQFTTTVSKKSHLDATQCNASLGERLTTCIYGV
jgi:hypothetical protein